MTKFNKTLLAAALALGASSAFANPTFLFGTSKINFDSLENHYRSDAACAATGGCLTHDAANDPSGWNRVDPTSVGATSIIPGDVFAGILSVYKINLSGWQPSAAEEFTGYFAQEVSAVDASVLTNAIIYFQNPTVDPFGVLGAGEMFRLYTDTSPDFTIGGTTFSGIANATDGTAGDALWGALGIGPEGYAYTRDDLTVSGNDSNFASKTYLAVDVVTTGPTYNLNTLKPVNDTSESQLGGATASGSLLCSPADLTNPLVLCNDIVGNADVKKNDFFATGDSPWYYEVNDPLYLHQIPEPGTIALLGMGLIGLAGLRRRAA